MRIPLIIIAIYLALVLFIFASYHIGYLTVRTVILFPEAKITASNCNIEIGNKKYGIHVTVDHPRNYSTFNIANIRCAKLLKIQAEAGTLADVRVRHPLFIGDLYSWENKNNAINEHEITTETIKRSLNRARAISTGILSSLLAMIIGLWHRLPKNSPNFWSRYNNKLLVVVRQLTRMDHWLTTPCARACYNFRHWRIVFFIIAIVISTYIFVMNFLTPLAADDFCYAFNGDQRLSSVNDVFQAFVYDYNNHTGRLFGTILPFYFSIFPKSVYNVANSLVFILFIYLTAKCAIRNSLSILVAFCCAFGMFWLFLPAFNKDILWISASCGYLWSGVAILLFLLPYHHQLLKKSQSRSPLFAFTMFIAGILAGWSLENAAMAVLGMLVFYFIHRKIVKYPVVS